MMEPQFNGLTAAMHERLAILSEELGEAVQAIGKILRHGYQSYDPTADGEIWERPTNRENLMRELGDVVFAISMLEDAGDITGLTVSDRASAKINRIKPYLHHQ